MRRHGLLAIAALVSALLLGVYAQLVRPGFALGFVMLVPWLAAQDATHTPRGTLGVALLFCVAFSSSVFGWFAVAMAGYTGAPRVIGWLALGLLAPTVLQPQVLVFALARHVARRRGAGPLRLACTSAFAWVGAEWLLPKLFADSLGHGLLTATWLRQAADLAGVGGLTLVLLLVNDCVLAALRAVASSAASGARATSWRARARAAVAPAVCAIALVVALAGYGAWRVQALDAELADAPRVLVGFVQTDVSHYGSLAQRLGTFDAVASILEAHLALSHQLLDAAPVELLVWPETIYPTTFGAPKSEEGARFDAALGAFVAGSRVPLVFGSFDEEDGAEFNAAVLLSPTHEGQVDFETYRKATLFPLTERVPAWLDTPMLRKRMPWLGSWQPGSGARVIPLRLADGRELRIAPLICYDATTPRIARDAARAGANLIVTLSNDSWFAAGGGPRLHLAVSAFRSLETRRAQLRATNTGVSAAILPDGEIVARADVHERAALAAELPLFAPPPTLAVAWGDWLGPTSAGLALLLLALPSRPPDSAGRASQQAAG